MTKHSVLAVDDEPEILEVVRAYLEREGFEVDTGGNVAEAMLKIGQRRPDLLILDVNLPDGSGLDILRLSSKDGSRIPAVMLTARGEETDRIVGLELGADDYITKPFSPREVVARVRALFRRLEEKLEAGAGKPARKSRIGDLEIDYEYHEVRVGGRAAHLTATEFKILSVLAENPGEVFSRAHLLDVLDDKGTIYERTLDRHINNLRKKVEVDPANPEHVLTVYGVGYKMRRG
ncbi:MAG: response regulator transcription factor [Candidatus Eremiobacteraeota bacterium]|nr:response regulator transcription factor [Candidatus Eremiobacteraeota bacterium]